jgi:hypothetical protein
VSCDAFSGEDSLLAKGAGLLTTVSTETHFVRMDFLLKGLFLADVALWASLLGHVFIRRSSEPQAKHLDFILGVLMSFLSLLNSLWYFVGVLLGVLSLG